MKIENQRVRDILSSIKILDKELHDIRENCNHIDGDPEYLSYNDEQGHKHTYADYECKLCGKWMGEKKVL